MGGGEKRGPGLREDKLGSIERHGLLRRGEREDRGMPDAAGSHSSNLMEGNLRASVCKSVCDRAFGQDSSLACLNITNDRVI